MFVRCRSGVTRSGLPALPLALLLALCLSASIAQAAVHQVTVTGQVLFFDEPFPYSLNDPAPVTGGETFTLTFLFDDAAPQTSASGTDVATYGAATSNLQFTTSNGLAFSATQEGVLAAINAGANHQWSVFVSNGSPGYSGNLPDPLSAFNEDTFEDEDFGLADFSVTLLDAAEGAYVQTPPELVDPDVAVFETQFASILWTSFETGASLEAVLEVSSVTSTPLAAAPGLGGLGLGLLSAVLLGVGGVTSRRSRR